MDNGLIPIQNPAPTQDNVAEASPDTAQRHAQFRRFAGYAGVSLATALLVFIVTLMLASGFGLAGVFGFGMVAFTMLSAASVVFAIRALFKLGPSPHPRGSIALLTVFPILGGALMTLFGVLLTLMATLKFSRGRQLRRFGQVLLPPVVPSAEWTREPLGELSAHPDRDALAAQWRENGRTEHASVAAFGRLTLDLIALGAPARLLRQANEDALDEIRHTELCFSLARAIDGREESPGAFPVAQTARTLSRNRGFALAQLAVDSLVDGALHEGLSARVIAKLAKRCEAPVVRAILKEIAADEGRHAAHGWDVVEWCLAEGGAPVAHALRGALAALPQAPKPERSAAAESGAWEPVGIHGAALEHDEFLRARADLIRRTEVLVGDASAPARARAA